MQPVRLRDFLEQTLLLWNVEGAVAERGEALVLHACGREISIERADAAPFRWFVRRSDEPRARGCASLLGVLSALRMALDVDRGTPLRVAPAPQ